MTKILQIVASLRIGGAEKVARDIGLFLDPSKYEVHYVVFGNEVGDYEGELIDRGCRVFHLPSPQKSYFAYMQNLRALMQEYQYVAVHAHTMFNIGWVMLAAKQCGVPIRIAHAHSALVNGHGLKKQVYEAVMRQMILKNATDLVACGHAAGIRLYGEHAYEKRGQCILNGIQTEAFAYREDKRNQIREMLDLQESFVIGHVGHMAKVKNQSFLLRLMPEILKRKPNARLLMLGEGEDRPLLERLILELGLREHVILTGNVRNVADYLCAMDVFAFPSLFEGMPLSILEVQANGLPCILSTGVPKDVFLTDLLEPLPLEQPQQWVDAICSAERKESEKYAEFLKKQGFDTSAVMKRIRFIYESRDPKASLS